MRGVFKGKYLTTVEKTQEFSAVVDVLNEQETLYLQACVVLHFFRNGSSLM